MKRIIKIFVILLVSVLTFNINEVKAEDNQNSEIKIYLFYGDGCPHCANEKKFLKELIKKYDNIEVIYYEVWNNAENDKLMNITKEKLGIERKGVPFTVIGNNGYVGYNENIGYQIEEVIKELSDSNNNQDKVKDDNGMYVVPIIGKVNARDVSLPLMAVVIGAVDGFNPCAMWVLLFLLSILIGMKNKKRAFCLGITFLVASASVYLLFMVAWLNIAISMTDIGILRFIVAIVALIGAAFNLKSYFKKTEDGCSVADAKKKKKVFEKIKKFTSEKSFILAILGIIALAVSVNLIELACSAGLPLLFTQILSFNNLSTFWYGFYIGLYILFFMLDDLIIFFIAMFTMKLTGISNKYTKYSHLIGGILMLVIGILLIVKPGILMFNI